MPRKTKYVKGGCITNWQELAHALHHNRWIYWGDRPKHPGWLRSMHFQVLDQAITRGILAVAVPTQLYICIHANDCGKTYEPGCTANRPHDFTERVCDATTRCVYAGVTNWCVPIDQYLQQIPEGQEEPCSQQD